MKKIPEKDINPIDILVLWGYNAINIQERCVLDRFQCVSIFQINKLEINF